ncbi:MAG: hypothetical protein PHW13_12025 [Methylococcales bacterium]|nr:hypothetical protein [Methylococcales bacterium]
MKKIKRYIAVKQFNDRNHDDKIFSLPFLYVAMDTGIGASISGREGIFAPREVR